MFSQYYPGWHQFCIVCSMRALNSVHVAPVRQARMQLFVIMRGAIVSVGYITFTVIECSVGEFQQQVADGNSSTCVDKHGVLSGMQ